MMHASRPVSIFIQNATVGTAPYVVAKLYGPQRLYQSPCYMQTRLASYLCSAMKTLLSTLRCNADECLYHVRHQSGHCVCCSELWCMQVMHSEQLQHQVSQQLQAGPVQIKICHASDKGNNSRSSTYQAGHFGINVWL